MTPATIRHRGLIIDLVDTETSSKLDRHGNRASVLEIDRVAPGMGKVFGPQCRVASEEVCFAGSQSTCLFQDPYLNTCTHDACRAAADAGRLLDAGRGPAEVLSKPLQELHLVAWGESREQGFDGPQF